MKKELIKNVLDGMRSVLSEEHLKLLHDTMEVTLENFDVCLKLSDGENREKENAELLDVFISAKKIEDALTRRFTIISLL